jgi:Protein of unknown function (DUF2889)
MPTSSSNQIDSAKSSASISTAQGNVQRELTHIRDLRVEVYKRVDNLWDVEARLTDRKPSDFHLATGPRSANVPVHDMTVCLTINDQFDVLNASARSHSVPYPGYCEAITPAYAQLVGLNLLKNFNREVRNRFGKTNGCTHITELTAVMPTAAVQAFAGEKTRPAGLAVNDRPPFYIDSCHALDRSGRAVKDFYPQWYRQASISANEIGAVINVPIIPT